MAISDKTRKLLWGRSGCRCAHCKHELIVNATPRDDESVVGVECHIVSSKKDGPRHDPAYPKDRFDDYENLILLCGTHHKMVDDQVRTYTVSVLQEMKSKHERSVSKTLARPSGLEDLALSVKASPRERGWQITLNVVNDGLVAVQTEKVMLWHPGTRPPPDAPTAGFDWRVSHTPMENHGSVYRRIGPGDTLPFHAVWIASPDEIARIPDDCVWIELQTSRDNYRVGGADIKARFVVATE